MGQNLHGETSRRWRPPQQMPRRRRRYRGDCVWCQSKSDAGGGRATPRGDASTSPASASQRFRQQQPPTAAVQLASAKANASIAKKREPITRPPPAPRSAQRDPASARSAYHDDDPTEAAERTDTGRLLVRPPLEAGRGRVVAPRRAAGAAVRHAGWRVVAAHVKVSCSCEKNLSLGSNSCLSIWGVPRAKISYREYSSVFGLLRGSR